MRYLLMVVYWTVAAEERGHEKTPAQGSEKDAPALMDRAPSLESQSSTRSGSSRDAVFVSFEEWEVGHDGTMPLRPSHLRRAKPLSRYGCLIGGNG